MPCCCACKSPLVLIAIVGAAAAIGFTALAGPDDKKVEQPKSGTPTTQPGKTDPAKPEAKPGETKPADAKPSDTKATDPYVLGFTMKRIDGTSDDLSAYKGKVVLIVNVASQCGNTPQYEGLEKLYESKKDMGLVILGFPANDFMHQEPGTNQEIKEFCTSKFGVSFPMFEKIVVKGPDAAPLYKKLAAQPAPVGGEPDWNFAKYLVDKNGNAVAHFKARVKPDNADLVKKIDELLAAPDPKAKQG